MVIVCWKSKCNDYSHNHSFFVRPCGNYSGTYKLQEAKYRFVGGRPTQQPFSKMYDDCIRLLRSIESDVTNHGTCNNLFQLNERGETIGINFLLACFFQRVSVRQLLVSISKKVNTNT